MVNRKGQAAMEFLMTYGWAILAAVIAIGVLAYFGVFSPESSLPPICQISQPFGCGEHQVIAGTPGQVRLIIPNGAGNSVDISSLVVTGCNDAAPEDPALLADGATLDVTIDCDAGNNFVAGERFNGQIAIDYLVTGKTIAQEATGKIRAAVA